MGFRSLRDAADDADAARFVGRSAELTVVDEVLDPATPSRILYVHGPGGIGKSALLRAAAALAGRRGLTPAVFDGRTLPAELERAHDELMAAGADRRCVVIDEVEELGPPLEVLRDRLLDALVDSSRLIVAGRRAPSPSWRAAGLDAIVVGLGLRPLPDRDSEELLRSRGIGEHQVGAIVDWAQGSPLALTVAASAPAGSPETHGHAALEQRLTQWLSGGSILDVPREVLEVAALSRTVDARLLSAVLPGRSGHDGLRRLAALPVVERQGDEIALHSVLGAAVREHVRATEPARAAELTRRIAAHLATRARLGDMGALLRLSRLLDAPDLRAAIGNEPNDLYYADTRLHPGELARFAGDHGFDRGADWAEIESWLRDRAEHTLLIRRHEGHAVMLANFVPVGALGASPDTAIEASLVSAAKHTDADPERSFAGFVLFAGGNEQERDAAEAARLGAGAFMMQQRVGDLRTLLIHYPEPDRRPHVPRSIASEVVGAAPRPVALSDFRPHGVVGNVEAMVLGEIGFSPRSADAAALLKVDDDPERIAALSQLLDEVFASTPEDRRLRRAIELVHLGVRTDEEECSTELSVSRRTWFRLLRTARERVVGAEDSGVPVSSRSTARS